ncbi:MAG: DeoR/GlpR family DNA-binding transcription regulator [Desulforhopalus sp.]
MKPDIIPAQRRRVIVDLLRQQGVLSVNQLSDATGVSHPTIRRDLDWLARKGLVERSHGGATLKVLSGTGYEPVHRQTGPMANHEKALIGRLAAERLLDNQSVIFDSSSTVLEAARFAAERGLHLTAVTNDIRISELFAASSSIKLIVCGGTLRPGSPTLVGEPGTSFLQQLHVDVAVMGIHGVKETLCCDTSLEVAYTKRHMVAAAAKVLVLVNSGKFGQIAFFEAFDIDDRFEIITDRPLSADVHQAIERRGATITCAGGGFSSVG